MSIKIMSLVWDNFKQGGSEKLVMLAMADWCNDHGVSLHPSHSAVSNKCCISRSQAQRIIRILEEQGWLIVVGNQYGGAPGTTKQYKINVEKLKNNDGSQDATGSTDATGSVDATGSAHAMRRVAPMHKTGSTHATQTTIEPPITTNIRSASNSPTIEPTPFDLFWKAYPKKVGRGAAQKVWMRLRDHRTLVKQILESLAWQKVSESWTKDNGQYVPNPSTYLSQERWLDEPIESKGSPKDGSDFRKWLL